MKTTASLKTIDWAEIREALDRQPWRPSGYSDPDRGPYETRKVRVLTEAEMPDDEAGFLALDDEAWALGYFGHVPPMDGYWVSESRYPDHD